MTNFWLGFMWGLGLMGWVSFFLTLRRDREWRKTCDGWEDLYRRAHRMYRRAADGVRP